MSRVQLALNVADIDEAIVFYSKLFATEPTKVRPGYANFAVVDPPLKLVLIEDASSTAGSLNHLGVEVNSTEEVATAQSRLTEAGLATAVEDEVACCYALQDKVWVDGPGGEPWEIYTVLADAEMPAGELRAADPSGAACCGYPARSRRRRPLLDLLLSDRVQAPGRTQPHHGRASTVATPPRRTVGQRLPRRHRHRLRHRRPNSCPPGDTGLQLFENAAATAAGLFAIILMFGPVSGGHFNPVVSFVDAAFGGLSWRDAAAYLPAQLAGCVGGAVVANVMFAEPVVSISTKHRASGPHFVSEVVATLGLLLVIFALARSGRSRMAPAAVGAYIGAAYFFTSSTSFANPAITVGRMFSNSFAGIAPSSAPLFIAAQVVGAGVAVLVIKALYPDVTPAEASDVVFPHHEAIPTNGARPPLPSTASKETT